MITTADIRRRYLEFFKEKGHTIVPSAPLVPENDPSVLFNTAGMQPLVPYLLGKPHPMGVRLADAQKCVRTGDIDDVGDDTHLTFFEMLGNWSLGDYFKQDSIAWSWEFLTDARWLALDPKMISVTVFEGDANAPRDEESAAIWKSLGMPEGRIAYLPAEDNWWAAGPTGPCGPDTEIFYWVGEGEPEGNKGTHPKEWMEIWNNVFMQYNRIDAATLEKLPKQCVDTGMGLERATVTLNGMKNVYETDAFADVLAAIRDIVGADHYVERSARIIADHLRAAVHIISDGIVPKNVDQGYVLRRLIRRAIREFYKMGYEEPVIARVAELFIVKFQDVYAPVAANKEKILMILEEEEKKFQTALVAGLKKFEKIKEYTIGVINFLKKDSFIQNLGLAQFLHVDAKSYLNFEPFQKLYDFANKTHGNPVATLDEKMNRVLPDDTDATRSFIKEQCEHILNNIQLNGRTVFDLYQNYGFPLEMIEEEAKKEGWTIDKEGFDEELKKHQDLSRTGSEGKFKGGLADQSAKVTAFHTATHLMLAGLRKELGDGIHQAGSNITEERTRFDFTYPEKVPREALDRVEAYVNAAIEAAASITTEVMDKEAARAAGIEGSFWEKYPDKVTVYRVIGPDGMAYSQELCGGPHVSSTSEIGAFGRFKIGKEEASSAGVRRVKAILEKK